jgi:hypothetical protein
MRADDDRAGHGEIGIETKVSFLSCPIRGAMRSDRAG